MLVLVEKEFQLRIQILVPELYVGAAIRPSPVLLPNRRERFGRSTDPAPQRSETYKGGDRVRRAGTMLRR